MTTKAKTRANTKAINLRIELTHEELVRDVISRIRTGGSGFRTALRALIDDEGAAEYVSAKEVHARFADLERRMKMEDGYVPSDRINERFDALERQLHTDRKTANEIFVPAPQINHRFSEIERRIADLEKRVADEPWIP